MLLGSNGQAQVLRHGWFPPASERKCLGWSSEGVKVKDLWGIIKCLRVEEGGSQYTLYKVQSDSLQKINSRLRFV